MTTNDKDLKREISTFLRELGIYPHYSGMFYLIDAVQICLDEPEMHRRSLTRLIYPQIAERHNITAVSVERCIRHAIEKSDPDSKQFHKIFDALIANRKKKKVTNSEFIFTVADEFRYLLDKDV